MESGSDVHRFPPSLPYFQPRRSSIGRFVLRRIYLGPYCLRCLSRARAPPVASFTFSVCGGGHFHPSLFFSENFSMPPAAALVITFGSLPMSDDQTNAMSVFDHHLSDFLTQTGLFSISAIEPEHGFLLFLHNVMGIVDVQTFVYSYTHFASAVGGTRPTPERFLHFFEMHGTEFKFIDTISGENVARAKDRIVARIMRLLEPFSLFLLVLLRKAGMRSLFLLPRRRRWKRFTRRSMVKTFHRPSCLAVTFWESSTGQSCPGTLC
jgi:hypothetical protein